MSDASRVRAVAMAVYGAGLLMEREGDAGGARTLYDRVLVADPGHWRLALRLAEEDVMQGRVDESKGRLEAAVAARPDAVEPRLALSDFLFRHRQVRPEWEGMAMALAEEAVARMPGEPEVHAHLVRLALQRGEREAAEAALARAVARSEARPAYWLGLTAPAMMVWPPKDSGHREKVLKLFRRAHELAHDDPQPAEALADFLATIGEMEEACRLYEGLTQSRPDNLPVREKLARGLTLNHQLSEALAAWEAVLRIDPQHEAAHRALARHFAKAGDLAGSVRHRAQAVRWGRMESLSEALKLVRDMLQAGLAREALPVLERAEFNAPQSPEPPYLAALAHQAAGDPKRSLAAFARAEAGASADEELAARFLTEGFYYEWALVAGQSGAIEEAEAKYREAISRVPQSAPELAAKSYNGLAYLWLETGRRLNEAGPLVDRALGFEPENPAYLDTRGWYLFKTGEAGAAVEVLLKAEKAAGKPVAEISDHRAQVLWALGRRDEAISLLETIVAWPDATPVMKERLSQWKAPGR